MDSLVRSGRVLSGLLFRPGFGLLRRNQPCLRIQGKGLLGSATRSDRLLTKW